MRPRSGLQQDVLRLWAAVLRAARRKPAADRAALETEARRRFRDGATSVKPTEVARIEWMLRMGARQLNAIQGSSAIFSMRSVTPAHDRTGAG